MMSNFSKSSLAQDNLKERLKFKELITHTSTKFLDLPANEIDQVLCTPPLIEINDGSKKIKIDTYQNPKVSLSKQISSKTRV